MVSLDGANFSLFQNYTIHYWIEMGAPAEKLILGMPLYGQAFTLDNPAEHGLNAPARQKGKAGQFTRAAGFLAYYEICHNINQGGWTVVQDPQGRMGPYAYKGRQWVGFDDVAMLRRKVGIVPCQRTPFLKLPHLSLNLFNYTFSLNLSVNLASVEEWSGLWILMISKTDVEKVLIL